LAGWLRGLPISLRQELAVGGIETALRELRGTLERSIARYDRQVDAGGHKSTADQLHARIFADLASVLKRFAPNLLEDRQNTYRWVAAVLGAARLGQFNVKKNPKRLSGLSSRSAKKKA
jgi:hypothetical protein